MTGESHSLTIGQANDLPNWVGPYKKFICNFRSDQTYGTATIHIVGTQSSPQNNFSFRDFHVLRRHTKNSDFFCNLPTSCRHSKIPILEYRRKELNFRKKSFERKKVLSHFKAIK